MRTEILQDQFRKERNQEPTYYNSVHKINMWSNLYVDWLENKLNNNEDLDIVSERELTNEDLVWYEDVIYEIDSIEGETAYITSLKCKTYEIVRKEQLTLVR